MEASPRLDGSVVGARETECRDEERAREERKREGTSKHSNYLGKETSADGALPFKANMAE